MAASLVVINPQASRVRAAGGPGGLREDVAAALLRRDGVRPSFVVPDSAAATADLVRQALAAGVAAVVGVGGDGTLKEIATALAGTDVPLGIVPGGTGNILAGVMGVPGRLGDAVSALVTAQPRTIDLGEVTLEPARPKGGGADPAGPAATRRLMFAIGCGLGFDARVMATTPPDLKRRFGRVAYFVQATRLAATLEAVPYRLTVDGDVIETEASIALVTNMGELLPGLVGPRLPVVPDDGLLDLFVLGARGPIAGVRGLIDHLWRTELGANRSASTLRVRGRRIRLSSSPPEPMQVDGDHFEPGALEAEVRPGALRVLVPSPAWARP